MKVLVTGARGFIGKNLCAFLLSHNHQVLAYDLDNKPSDLDQYVRECDFIFHLAGINRPLNDDEFKDGNVNFTERLLETLKKYQIKVPLVFSSSTHAERTTPYGISKRMAEEMLFLFAKEEGVPIYVYRLYNVFGKWSRPQYNSVIATFCYNVAHDLPLTINKDAPAIDFVYIDDICKEFLSLLESQKKAKEGTINYVEPHYSCRLEEVADLLLSFKNSRENFFLPNQKNDFAKKLYATYLTYLDEDKLTYPLLSHVDNRGSFTEIFKSPNEGQISLNIGKPGIVKGNHYHHTKNEKYLVIKGKCLIKLRRIDQEKMQEIIADDQEFKVIDIPPGYVHSIENIGSEDSLTLMWANELYDPMNPDTYPMLVEKEK